MNSEGNTKINYKLIGIIVIAGIATMGFQYFVPQYLFSNQKLGAKRAAAAGEQYIGAIIRASQAFYADERRFPQNYKEIMIKFKGVNTGYVSGNILDHLDESSMKLAGYSFDTKLVDRNNFHIFAIPLYQGDYPTIVGKISVNSTGATFSKVCKSEKFTNGSTEFPTENGSGELICPSGYKNIER